MVSKTSSQVKSLGLQLSISLCTTMDTRKRKILFSRCCRSIIWYECWATCSVLGPLVYVPPDSSTCTYSGELRPPRICRNAFLGTNEQRSTIIVTQGTSAQVHKPLSGTEGSKVTASYDPKITASLTTTTTTTVTLRRGTSVQQHRFGLTDPTLNYCAPTAARNQVHAA